MHLKGRWHHLCLAWEVEAWLFLASWMCTWLADYVDHARFLVSTAVKTALAALMVKIWLLDASLMRTVAAGDIDHALCLVLAAVQPICLAWVVA